MKQSLCLLLFGGVFLGLSTSQECYPKYEGYFLKWRLKTKTGEFAYPTIYPAKNGEYESVEEHAKTLCDKDAECLGIRCNRYGEDSVRCDLMGGWSESEMKHPTDDDFETYLDYVANNREDPKYWSYIKTDDCEVAALISDDNCYSDYEGWFFKWRLKNEENKFKYGTIYPAKNGEYVSPEVRAKEVCSLDDECQGVRCNKYGGSGVRCDIVGGWDVVLSPTDEGFDEYLAIVASYKGDNYWSYGKDC